MSVEFPQHTPNPYFDVEDDCLLAGGEPITRIAARVGPRPFYVYDRGAMQRRIDELRAAIPDGISLHYAMKANPMPGVVEWFAQRLEGLDVASAGELRVALAAGANPQHISFAGPGKRDVELAEAAHAGIVVNVESEREIPVLARIGEQTGRRPRVAIRVNPDFELKSSGMKMGGGPKQFGIDAERVPQVLQSLRGIAVEFVGFHIFSGSQNLKPESIVDSQSKALELAERLAPHAPSPVRLLNIGGGFGIPYFPGEVHLDLAPIGAHLRTVRARAAEVLPQAELVIELGRYLVGESGLYVCNVIDRKVSRGQTFLVTDGGLHHHLSASGNFGQVIRKNYPVAVANKVRGAARETASVVGPLCTPLDLLADRYEMARAEPGDLVAVFQSGAYGLSASPTAFLSHPGPAEIIVG